MKKYFKILFIMVVVFAFIGNVNAAGSAAETVVCGDITDIPAGLPVFTSNLVTLFKIVAPIILIIMGMIDFGRSVIAHDEKTMEEAKPRFIRRVIAAVIIFISFVIVQFVLTVIGSASNSVLSNMNYFINGDCLYETSVGVCIKNGREACTDMCTLDGVVSNTCFSACVASKTAACNFEYGVVTTTDVPSSEEDDTSEDGTTTHISSSGEEHGGSSGTH